MTREKFSKLGKSMGYANEDVIKEFVKDYPDDYEFTDNDFIKLYRKGTGHETRNLAGWRLLSNGPGNNIKTTKHFIHTHTH